MPNIDLSTQIGGFKLDNLIFNASGPRCTTKEDLTVLLESSSGAFISKSATTELREGNPCPRYVSVPLGSINSMGLPNLGIDFYLDYFKQHQKSLTKPMFLSVAGLSLEENLEILHKIHTSDFIFPIELNLSCPNVPGKPQTAYDFERTQEVLEKVFKFYEKPLGIKLPPYFDLIHFEQIALILNRFPIQFVTCVNSIGNGLYIDVDKESVVIKPKNGFGGMGGDYIKPTALANVRQFYTLLRKDIQIIGCGGIKNGQDVFEHILCGASAVQIGTQLMKEDVATCFNRISQELENIMYQKGYSKIEQFKGKLKTL
ncbi:MAG: dihydroorotate oxidase [Flavobacteriales bacterium]